MVETTVHSFLKRVGTLASVDDRYKVQQLFKFLSEMSILRDRTILDVTKHLWYLYLDEIPSYPESIAWGNADYSPFDQKGCEASL